MGHIAVETTFYNATDYVRWLESEISQDKVRRVKIKALVDTGATYPALPEDLVEKLGLTCLGEVEVAEGKTMVKLYGLTIIKIEDRIAVCPAILRPRGSMPIVGVVALEQTGFRVDPTTGKLIRGLPYML